MAGPTREELKEELKKEKPYVPPSSGKDKKEADIFREGMKPPSPDEGPVTLPGKPGKAPEPKNLPGKPEKKKDLGEGATKYAKGGTASARADGCAIRGKTRGKMV